MEDFSPLQESFYGRDTLEVARDVLGKRLVRIDDDGAPVIGLILEAEAYVGQSDLGCHGKSGRTPRNNSLWQRPGTVYVYFTYGMHWLVNFVTERADFPSAVLIRSVLPIRGLERIRRRRGVKRDSELTNGPAKICQAFGIDAACDGLYACGRDARVFIEHGPGVDPAKIQSGPRIGLENVPEPWKSVPWRFWARPEDLNGNLEEKQGDEC